MPRIRVCTEILLLLLFFFTSPFTLIPFRFIVSAAPPASDHYELQNYAFGSGGVSGGSSGSYSIFGIAGEQMGDQAQSSAYKTQPGLVYVNQASLPPAPVFSNPGSTYNRLEFVIGTGGNPVDAQYAIAITRDNWVTTRYIQSDYTIGDVIGNEDWLTYSGWGGISGRYVTGLLSSTVYKIKVKARTGGYTETGWGSEATASTLAPSLTFGVDASAVTFNPLNSENSFTDSSKHTVLTTSTNAYNGYTVYARETSKLTYLTHTIDDYSSPNSLPTVWSGTGFGYTTSDSTLAGGDGDRFTAGGPKYAGFTTSAPGDPVADHVGPIVETPITNEQVTVSYRVTAPENSVAGRYKNSLIYVVVPVY